VSVKERRAREKAELRQEILHAARELFAKEGYENVSMRKIAEKIDYSPTTIYLYFQDKDELLRSICEEPFAELVKELEEIEARISDPIEQLKRVGRAYVAFGLSHPNHYEVTFMGAGHRAHMAEPNFAYQGSMGEKCFMHLRATVERCVQQGKFRPLDLDATSQALWATVHGITSLLITHPHFPWVDGDRLVEQIIDVMTVGWKR
jgi:AcrR family transcriptional regulator